MINTEKQILATVLIYPETAALFFANLDEDSFLGMDNRVIFKTMKTQWETGRLFDRFVMIDFLPEKSSFFADLAKYTEGVNVKTAEKFLADRIRALKGSRTKKKLLSEIQIEANMPQPDFEKIIEIAESGKLVELSKEEGDFETAFNEYLKWKEEERPRINLGFPAFDKKTGNYNYGEILSIMARTTVGKTFIALNIINQIVGKIEDKIGLFSLEMAKAVIIERMLQLHFNSFWMELDEKRKARELYLDEFMARFRERLKIFSRIYGTFEIGNIIKRDGLKIVFIDYLQLLRKGREGRSRYEKVTYLTEEIKEIAKNQDVFIILLVQITREGEGGWEPVTIDMARESGAIEENSDFIIGAWNPSLREGADQQWDGRLCMKLLKNKRGPQVGCVFNFDKNSRKLYELAAELPNIETNEEWKDGKPNWAKD